MNIAAVGAHPDDIELLCGGTMARYVKMGHRVTIIIATNGEAGSPAVSREEIDQFDRTGQSGGKARGSAAMAKEEIASIRHEEAKEGARIIGADLIWLGYPDEFLFETEQTRLAVLEALRKSRADVVFAVRRIPERRKAPALNDDRLSTMAVGTPLQGGHASQS